MNKGFKLTEKNTIRRSNQSEKLGNEQPLAYVSTYKKNKLSIEISRNLDQLKSNYTIKSY